MYYFYKHFVFSYILSEFKKNIYVKSFCHLLINQYFIHFVFNFNKKQDMPGIPSGNNIGNNILSGNNITSNNKSNKHYFFNIYLNFQN